MNANMLICPVINWHIHLREGEYLERLVKMLDYLDAALCMTNLSKLVDSAKLAKNYKKEILAAGAKFEPTIPIMLTQVADEAWVKACIRAGFIHFKFIPDLVSTNSETGLSLADLAKKSSLLSMISSLGGILHIHAEKGGEGSSLIDREAESIPILKQMAYDHPLLKMVIEHVSTKAMLDFIDGCRQVIGYSLTPQHALFTYEDVYDKQGNCLDPLKICMPIAKTEADRAAIEARMVSGDKRCYFGSDFAPHPRVDKWSLKPKAGVFFGSYDILLVLEIFDRNGALNKFRDFVYANAQRIFNLPAATSSVVFEKIPCHIPKGDEVYDFCLGGRELAWSITNVIRVNSLLVSS